MANSKFSANYPPDKTVQVKKSGKIAEEVRGKVEVFFFCIIVTVYGSKRRGIFAAAEQKIEPQGISPGSKHFGREI